MEYARHNASVYNVEYPDQLQLVHSDYLRVSTQNAMPQFEFPSSRKPGFDSVFLSPPWGGSGYQMLSEYSLDHIYPDFDKIISHSLKFSGNLMLFLPKNTSVTEIVDRLVSHHHLLTDQKSSECIKDHQLVLEIEQLTYGNSCKALLVCTGSLAKVTSSELAQHFVSQCCNQYGPGSQHSGKSSDQDQKYLI